MTARKLPRPSQNVNWPAALRGRHRHDELKPGRDEHDQDREQEDDPPGGGIDGAVAKSLNGGWSGEHSEQQRKDDDQRDSEQDYGAKSRKEPPKPVRDRLPDACRRPERKADDRDLADEAKDRDEN